MCHDSFRVLNKMCLAFGHTKATYGRMDYLPRVMGTAERTSLEVVDTV